MKTYLAIIAHMGARETIIDFWPAWERLGVPIVGFLPDGEVWPVSPCPDFIFTHGKSAHTGPNAFARFVHCLRTMRQLAFERFIIIEPDCLPLKPQLPAITPGAFSSWTCRIKGGAETFELCALPPWTFDRASALTLLAYIERTGAAKVSHPDCGDFTDRWLMKCAIDSGVKLATLDDCIGYCVSDDHHEMIRRAKPAWVHGYKRKAQLGDLWPAI